MARSLTGFIAPNGRRWFMNKNRGMRREFRSLNSVHPASANLHISASLDAAD